MSDRKFEKLMDMFEVLHAENIYLLKVMCYLTMKPDKAEEAIKELEKPLIDLFDKVRKKW